MSNLSPNFLSADNGSNGINAPPGVKVISDKIIFPLISNKSTLTIGKSFAKNYAVFIISGNNGDNGSSCAGYDLFLKSATVPFGL